MKKLNLFILSALVVTAAACSKEKRSMPDAGAAQPPVGPNDARPGPGQTEGRRGPGSGQTPGAPGEDVGGEVRSVSLACLNRLTTLDSREKPSRTQFESGGPVARLSRQGPEFPAGRSEPPLKDAKYTLSYQVTSHTETTGPSPRIKTLNVRAKIDFSLKSSGPIRDPLKFDLSLTENREFTKKVPLNNRAELLEITCKLL